tara:strand:- start:10332 stop:10946 length:615 start_codon:yes stop_codon:yes gene_type:complete
MYFKNKIKIFLYHYLRINRAPSNRLATLWLKKDLYKIRNYHTAIDVGCGKFINRRYFKNKNYVGVDIDEDILKGGLKIYPNTKYFKGSVLNKLPVKGDIIVATLLLTTQSFPVNKTINAINNLIEAVNKEGDLIFTIGRRNYIYKDEIFKVLKNSFYEVKMRQYGNFNKPSILGVLISFAMYLFPKLRINSKNKMFYCVAKNKK